MTKTQTTTTKMTTNMTTENSKQNVFTRNDNDMTIKMAQTLFGHQFMPKFLCRGPCRPVRSDLKNSPLVVPSVKLTLEIVDLAIKNGDFP